MNLPTNSAEAIAFYTAHHLPITPVRPSEKKGRFAGWSLPGHSSGPEHFRLGDNVGVINGTEPEKGWFFHDIDIDANSDAARTIVERVLPPTGWRYGRPSKPRSHANYLVQGQLRTRKYVGADSKCLLELRGITQKKTHTLSVGAGSTHTSGEAIRFVEPVTAIGRIQKPEDLDTAVQRAAVGIIIASAWPSANRHKLRLAFAKVLLEHGLTPEHTTSLLEIIMDVTGSDISDVAPAVAATEESMREGHPTAGASVVTEILGQATLSAISSVLRAHSSQDDGTSVNINELTTTMVDRAWTQVVSANEPPGLFRRSSDVLILHNSDNTCLNTLYEQQVKLEEPSRLQHVSGFRKIDVETFREIVGRMVPCVQVSERVTRTKVYPSREFASLMLASPTLPLPEPTGFTPIPFFTQEGMLVTTPGLHRDTGFFYQPLPGFQMPDIPEKPTPVEVQTAVAVLDEMVWQFPFKGREGQHPYLDVREGRDWLKTASYANMMAFPLTILTRSLFHAVPLFLFDKPSPRTGASTMVQCWSYVLTGAWPSEAEWDGSESERRKFLTAILITGAPIIFLDEVKDLKSPDLNKILTGKNARIGRVLGSTEITAPQNFSTFTATGNNPAFPKDMAGRMCRVRLDTGTENPSERKGWDKDIVKWTPEHRMELLAALYVLVRAWFSSGRPSHPDQRVLNGFESWSYTIGGILYNAGLTEFMANKRDVEEDAESEEEDEVEGLLESWAASYPDQDVSTATLLKLEGLPVFEGSPWSARQLGAWIRRNRDRTRRIATGQDVRVVKGSGEQRWRMRILGETIPLAGMSEADDSVPF